MLFILYEKIMKPRLILNVIIRISKVTKMSEDLKDEESTV